MIEGKQPFGPPSPWRLAAFELTLLPYRLPEDVRSFLDEYNGAKFIVLEELPDEPRELPQLGLVFGLHGGEADERLDAVRAMLWPKIPHRLLVFGTDTDQAYMAMSLGGDDRGAIYLLDVEQSPVMSSATKVAASFAEILERSGTSLLATTPSPDLASALGEDYRAVLRELIESGTAGTAGAGHVHFAVRSGDIEVLRMVLDAGGDANEPAATDGETPLIAAARAGHADMTQLLLQRGADPEARRADGATARAVAAPFPDLTALLRKDRA